MSAVSSSFTVSSCLIWTCLLVSRRPRTWAIRRENSLLFCLPAGKCMYWEKVRILNVPICLRCAAVFPEVNAKLISTLQHVNCPSLGLHGRHTAGYTNEMRWNCDHIQYCKRSGLNITTGDKCQSTKHEFLCENGSQAASVSLQSFHFSAC